MTECVRDCVSMFISGVQSRGVQKEIIKCLICAAIKRADRVTFILVMGGRIIALKGGYGERPNYFSPLYIYIYLVAGGRYGEDWGGAHGGTVLLGLMSSTTRIERTGR